MFEPLQVFYLHLEEEYRGCCLDQMQQIHDFKREKDDTYCTIYTILVRFLRELRGVFPKSQLVNVFLLKIDKRLLDLVLSKIIMDYGNRTIFAEAFAVIKQCDRALCHYDATDLVSFLMDSSKFKKTPVAAV